MCFFGSVGYIRRKQSSSEALSASIDLRMMLYSAMSAAQFESVKAERADMFNEPGWKLPAKTMFVNKFQATLFFIRNTARRCAMLETIQKGHFKVQFAWLLISFNATPACIYVHAACSTVSMYHDTRHNCGDCFGSL